MARAPNYNHERMERDRAKANKKAEKLAAKVAARKPDLQSSEQTTQPAGSSEDQSEGR